MNTQKTDMRNENVPYLSFQDTSRSIILMSSTHFQNLKKFVACENPGNMYSF